MAREISVETITQTIKKLFMEACVVLPPDMTAALQKGARIEKDDRAQIAFATILENIDIAANESVPLCQDTGAAIIFMEIGQEVHIVNGDLNKAVQRGVREACREGFLRKSICDPLSRQNTLDNTPAFAHYEIIAGEKIQGN